MREKKNTEKKQTSRLQRKPEEKKLNQGSFWSQRS
jgi:hypothetical protein